LTRQIAICEAWPLGLASKSRRLGGFFGPILSQIPENILNQSMMARSPNGIDVTERSPRSLPHREKVVGRRLAADGADAQLREISGDAK
jgi:hypothetical protein